MGNSPITSRINALLAEKGISKQEFYKGCGISSASYSLWNTGKTFPKRKSLEKVADFLDTSVDYLLTGLGEKERIPNANSGKSSRLEKLNEADIAFYGRYKALDEKGREDLLDFIEILEERQKRRGG